MLVETGLNCLLSLSKPFHIRQRAEEEIKDAIELSQQLMFNLLTEQEKTDIIWKETKTKASEARKEK